MNSNDINEYIERYTSRFRQFGYSPETLGWGKHGRQQLRFGILAADAIKNNKSSVLDIGCGFADLYSFLKSKGWAGKYTGIDIVPVLVEKAKELLPEVDIKLEDIYNKEIPNYDYVIASGIFNASLVNRNNNEHIEKMVTRMFDLCNVSVNIDFLSSYVDFQKTGSHHTDPSWAFCLAKKLSKRVNLRYDYMPFEFSLFIYKNDGITESNTFEFDVQ